MPNRIVRDGIIDSRAVNSLSEEAELFYRHLISVVDDFGRIEADPELLRVKCFPRRLDAWTVSRVTVAMQETSRCMTDDGAPLVSYYQVGPKRFLQINNFGQRIRAERSKCPSPDGQMTVNCQTDDGPPHASRAQGRSESKSESESETKSIPVAAVEAPVVIAIPAPIEQQQQQQMPPLACIGEYPKTLSACRAHDPGVDDLFVLRLVQAVIQGAISHHVTNGKLEKINDRAISKAVEESYATGPPTHRAGLLLNRVPSIIVSWCQEDN